MAAGHPFGADGCPRAGHLRQQRRGQLVALVSKAKYSPQEMAADATDLINEATTNKITGEEERYSHTDLVDFDANMKASMKVADLLSPYLQTVDPDLVSLIQQRNDAV